MNRIDRILSDRLARILIAAGLIFAVVCGWARAADPVLVRDWRMNGDRKEISWGTAFAVAPGKFITAAHTLKGNTLEIGRSGDWKSATVLLRDDGLDLVLLASAATADVFQVAEAFDERGEFRIDGFPEGKRGTLKKVTFKELSGNQLLLNAAGFDHGHSGSPLLDARDCVVGVAVSGLKAGDDLDRKHAFAVRLVELREFLRRANALPVEVPREFTEIARLAPPTTKAEPIPIAREPPRAAKLLAAFSAGADWRAVKTPAGIVWERADSDALGGVSWRRASAQYEDPEWARAAIAALAGRE